MASCHWCETSNVLSSVRKFSRSFFHSSESLSLGHRNVSTAVYTTFSKILQTHSHITSRADFRKAKIFPYLIRALVGCVAKWYDVTMRFSYD